jgi:putative ABC transport system ATP-binding protein
MKTEDVANIITTCDLTLNYVDARQQTTALAAIDLSVERGQLVAVLGPSGSGKTSLLHVLAGLRDASSGRVRVAGQDLGHMSEDERAVFRRRNVGIVFQFFNLSPMLSVEENIALPCLCDGHSMNTLRPRITILSQRLGIAHLTNRSVTELSGGEQQRVAIARALLPEPPLILADEPTGNLDSERGVEILRLLRELVDERQVTVVLMTHDLRATEVADRILVLRDGCIDEDLRGVAARRRLAPDC